MKRKILPIAVATAFTGGAMQVSADTTLYGDINVSLQSVDSSDQTGTTIEENWQLISNASFLGLRGSGDLDNDIKAIWQIELEFSTDDGDFDGDEFGQRNTYIGVEAGWGQIKAGKFDTPTRVAALAVDQFNDYYAGDIYNVMVGETRADNIVQFTSVDYSGVTFALAIAPGEEQGPNAQDDGLADGISASVAYTAKNLLGEGSELELALTIDQDIAGADLIRLIASTELSGFDIGFLYQTAEESETDTGFNQRGIAALTSVGGNILPSDQDAILLSLAYDIDAKWTVKGQFAYSETDGAEVTSFGPPIVFTGADATVDVNSILLGADYKLGEGTMAYAYLGMNEGETNLAGADTIEETTFGVGMSHAF